MRWGSVRLYYTIKPFFEQTNSNKTTDKPSTEGIVYVVKCHEDEMSNVITHTH